MQLINKEKLLEWLKRERLMSINEDISWAYRVIELAIESEQFDETQ